jgi:hypothetical protein
MWQNSNLGGSEEELLNQVINAANNGILKILE